MSEISKEEFDKAKLVVDKYLEQEKIKQDNVVKTCKHIRTKEEPSEWHPNGRVDRWTEYCLDCGLVLKS